MTEDNRFDGILMSIIQQKGNIDGFFDTVFGFLRRNTDFFANQKKAEQIIVGSCKKNFDKYTTDENQKKKQQQKKKQAQQRKKKQKQQQQRQKAAKLDAEKKAQTKPAEQQKVDSEKQQEGQTKKQDDGQPAPLGNGGRTEKYIWTQTLENLEMFVPIASDVNKKLIKVNIGLDTLKVVVNNQTIIDGKLKDKINAQDSIWTIESGEIQDYKGRYIHINIEKWKNQTSWWNTPIQGDKEINTQKINPQPSKLSDLDGETRSTVQKMMFDMRQKQQGLPTSQELQKQQKMKQFMKAHPELDFSQCKFN